MADDGIVAALEAAARDRAEEQIDGEVVATGTEPVKAQKAFTEDEIAEVTNACKVHATRVQNLLRAKILLQQNVKKNKPA